MYILFEGIDTVGKTTQIEKFAKEHPETITTKEPGGTEFGKKIREIVLNNPPLSIQAEIFLFLADRAEHYHQIIEPNRDKLIISDRGFLSGMAYALANENIKKEILISLNKFALQNSLPDRIILFLTNKETLEKRFKEKRNLDSIEKRGIDYLLKVQEEMKNLIDILDISHICVDTTQDIETIYKTILTYLKQ